MLAQGLYVPHFGEPHTGVARHYPASHSHLAALGTGVRRRHADEANPFPEQTQRTNLRLDLVANVFVFFNLLVG